MRRLVDNDFQVDDEIGPPVISSVFILLIPFIGREAMVASNHRVGQVFGLVDGIMWDLEDLRGNIASCLVGPGRLFPHGAQVADEVELLAVVRVVERPGKFLVSRKPGDDGGALFIFVFEHRAVVCDLPVEFFVVVRAGHDPFCDCVGVLKHYGFDGSGLFLLFFLVLV